MNLLKIPNELLKEWKKIGKKAASQKAKKHEIRIKIYFNSKPFNSFKNLIEKN